MKILRIIVAAAALAAITATVPVGLSSTPALAGTQDTGG